MTLTYFLLDFLISKVFIDVLLICDVILHQNLGAMRKKKSLYFLCPLDCQHLVQNGFCSYGTSQERNT